MGDQNEQDRPQRVVVMKWGSSHRASPSSYWDNAYRRSYERGNKSTTNPQYQPEIHPSSSDEKQEDEKDDNATGPANQSDAVIIHTAPSDDTNHVVSPSTDSTEAPIGIASPVATQSGIDLTRGTADISPIVAVPSVTELTHTAPNTSALVLASYRTGATETPTDDSSADDLSSTDEDTPSDLASLERLFSDLSVATTTTAPVLFRVQFYDVQQNNKYVRITTGDELRVRINIIIRKLGLPFIKSIFGGGMSMIKRLGHGYYGCGPEWSRVQAALALQGWMIREMAMEADVIDIGIMFKQSHKSRVHSQPLVTTPSFKNIISHTSEAHAMRMISRINQLKRHYRAGGVVNYPSRSSGRPQTWRIDTVNGATIESGYLLQSYIPPFVSPQRRLEELRYVYGTKMRQLNSNSRKLSVTQRRQLTHALRNMKLVEIRMRKAA